MDSFLKPTAACRGPAQNTYSKSFGYSQEKINRKGGTCPKNSVGKTYLGEASAPCKLFRFADRLGVQGSSGGFPLPLGGWRVWTAVVWRERVIRSGGEIKCN